VLRLGVLAREPLANGYLTGKYQPGTRITTSDNWRAGQDPPDVQRKLELVEQIRRTEVPPAAHVDLGTRLVPPPPRCQQRGRGMQIGGTSRGERRRSRLH
jgi:hypothetical protein